MFKLPMKFYASADTTVSFKKCPPSSDKYYIIKYVKNGNVFYLAPAININLVKVIELGHVNLNELRIMDNFSGGLIFKIRGNIMDSLPLMHEVILKHLQFAKLAFNDINTMDDYYKHNKKNARKALDMLFSGNCYMVRDFKASMDSEDYFEGDIMDVVNCPSATKKEIINYFENVLENGYYKTT